MQTGVVSRKARKKLNTWQIFVNHIQVVGGTMVIKVKGATQIKVKGITQIEVKTTIQILLLGNHPKWRKLLLVS
jgi:hypothetical protein